MKKAIQRPTTALRVLLPNTLMTDNAKSTSLFLAATSAPRLGKEEPMKWLITGGCGFIGVNLVKELLARGDRVRVLDNLTVGSRDDLRAVADFVEGDEQKDAAADVELIVGDIRDAAVVDGAVRGVDAVVHLAAQTGVIPSIEDPRLGCDLNVGGTLNLLTASRDHGVESFVLPSSGATLGEQSLPLTEEKVPSPQSPYGASKLAGEAYCQAFHATWGLPAVVLRFSNVYGPYSFKKGSVVAAFLRSAFSGRPLTIYGDGAQTRDFIHTSDICQAILKASSGSFGGQVFQIATERETTIGELATRVKTLFERDLGRSVEIVKMPPRKGEVLRNSSEIKKARALMGFAPKVELDRGLEETFAWFRAIKGTRL
jgi:UDP-glucose 4-epimerase